MFRSHAYLLQIGAKNVRRRSHQDQVYQFARASFASDKHAKVNKRSSDGRDVRKREERGSNLVSNKVEGQSLKKLGNPQAVKDILRDILVRVVDLKQTIGGLNDLPPVWAQEQDYQDSRRNDAFHSLKAIISDFEHQVRLGVIKANGKHRHECSVLLEEILRLLSLCGAHSDELSPFDECRRLLDLMEKEWKIELQHNHCEYAVVTASREQRWSEAADVFWRHIDPNRAGYNPCDISITEPIGLYAIARDAQQKKRSAVERVFDAVLRMSMVSPSDQDRYVIAAGTAMGLVGEWQGVVDFLNKASNAGKFGQPLVAAGMKACILCEQYDHAVRLYNELLDANHVANEWQWSGGEDRLHPLCRDLALIALGRTSQTGTSERALAILNAVLEDGAKISSKALFGTLLACEKDGNWRDAIRIALLPFHFHYRSLLASDDEHLLSTFGETGPPSETLDGSLHMLLLPVIRTCTSQGFPGAAVLSQILFATCYEQYVKFESSFGNQHRGCIDSLLRLLSVPCSSKEELLTAIMVSLCGIDSFAEACMIFEETNSGLVAAEVQEVYDWARSQNNKVVSDEWQILFERVQRVAALSLGASRGQVILSAEDLRLISDATATCMRCSVIMSEPGVGLVLSQWLESPTLLAMIDSRTS
ncbi:hypothetical protein FisN_4Lh497 [Fistulifera solaris]|uniref:Uncharacterized protein n=1 Tax=Fistulifera solaris TaxID=1519565 RepID=A0A1Z5KDN5_FISSO|nr:hypothetical protein FisN_4Lh497 [Fistulifera solaris]|eukprot:GAX24373.1 hypothetical protein FisN_4Lh497 [Fistulifera solaris]